MSGKPGPKASSPIEMYREREHQASGGTGGGGGGGGGASGPTVSPGMVRRLSQQAKEKTTALPALREPELEQQDRLPYSVRIILSAAGGEGGSGGGGICGGGYFGTAGFGS